MLIHVFNIITFNGGGGGSSPAGPLLGSRSRVAAGATVTLSQATVQNVEVTVQTAAASPATVVKFPASPADLDCVALTSICAAGVAPTTPTQLQANGSGTIGDPNNPGLTTNYASTVTVSGVGWTGLYQYDLTNTRWVPFV